MNEFWDRRYSEPGYAYGTEPNAFLVSQRHRLRAGMRALAVGDGEGRNGVWLAAQGLEVLSVDASRVGLAKARALAEERGVRIRTEVADLASWTWPRAAFDLVVSIFVHLDPRQRPLIHQAMVEALAPGGWLILEAFTPAQLGLRSGGPTAREWLYTAEQLRADFAGTEIVLLEETSTDLAEGVYHRGRAAVVRLVAKRPDDSSG
jgi:SAM-dependent methyltransferase